MLKLTYNLFQHNTLLVKTGKIEISNNNIRFINATGFCYLVLQNNNWINDFMNYWDSSFISFTYNNDYCMYWDFNRGIILYKDNIIFKTSSFIELINYFK